MLDTGDAIKLVLTSSNGARIKHLYGIDTVGYAWVDSYLKDKNARAEIVRLEGEISKVSRQPIHRDELKASFVESLKEINMLMSQQIASHLARAQNRETDLLDVNNIMVFRIVYPLNLTPNEIDTIFSRLPEGVMQSEIDKSIGDIRAQIYALRNEIDTELSPQGRWIHYDTGHAYTYPSGCRWTAFVNDWKTVACRFAAPVNIEGYAPESSAEETAYFALGLNDTRKAEPLKAPYVLPARPKSAQEFYKASVKITPR
jgi:hypothetical protein